MEAKTALVPCVMVLVVLAPLLTWPTTAQDPFVGISIRGPRKLASGALECCNNCRCERSPYWSCTCDDRTEFEYGCTAGCYDCRCDPQQFPSCYCADELDYCPDSCGFRSLNTAPPPRTTTESSSSSSSSSVTSY